MAEKYISRRDFLKKTAVISGATVLGGKMLGSTPKAEVPGGAELDVPNAPTTSQTTTAPETSPREPEAIEWLPDEVKALWPTIVSSAKEFDIDPKLVAIIITEESGGKNIANSEGSGAMGPMQLMPIAMQEYVNKSGDEKVRDISNPVDNIYVGCWHINNVNENYLKPAGIDIYSDLGILALAVGYGDGVGAFRDWQRNGMKTSGLSNQAKYVSRLWTGMWHERNQQSSYTLNSERGYNT